MLKIKFTENQQQAFWVTENIFSLGRRQDNHLVIEHSSLSPNHACFIREDGGFTLQDMNSIKGTYINNKLISKTPVSYGDKILLGEVSLEVIDPFAELNQASSHQWSLIADSGWLSGQEFPLALARNVPITIGRGKRCDLIFPSTHLSRVHAQITPGREGLILEDLNSVNGTHLNGEKIVKAKLSPGDRIQLDTYSFILFGPGIDLLAAANKCFDNPEEPSQSRPIPPTGKQKSWKTRSTSPGNREEPSYEEKPFPWTLELIVLTLFAATVIYLLMG
ncbi:MAG: FHA domain-containing protein [Cellvibrionaceae bacterium]|nr:FHA domain-containing protein [Cellvibrionaceae bacterium]